MSNSRFHNFQLPIAGFRNTLLVFLGVVVALGVGSSACAKAQASSVPNGPPLQVPAAPARVIVPAEEPLQVAAPAAPAPADPAPAAAAPARTPPRAPEPKPQPPAPAAAAAPPPAAPTDGRDLRATTSPANTATERSVRDTLTRASRDINRVDYRSLSADGRAQYDQSKRFSQQAEEALKERNYVFAATLADKAAQIAEELLK